MRAGACAVQQTLTSEAASVLKHSLSLARRRGHAQVTPLHVAATLLSSRTSLLRRACLKSHPHPTSHPLQCRALELCFNVALNRLPTTPGTLLHGQPSLSNALIAALKRAQAHQRRGCIEQQQQQPLLAIKVELEQLIISILDDPSVSRVMREAGFSSTSVKNNLEDSSSSTSVFQCYSGSSTIIPSPCSSPPIIEIHHRSGGGGGGGGFHHHIINNNSQSSGFWQTHFMNCSSEQNPVLFSTPKKHLDNFFKDSPSSTSPPITTSHENKEEDLRVVLDVFLRKNNKRRNTVVVGDSMSAVEALVGDLMGKVERGEVPDELKSAHFIKFHFPTMTLRFMKKEDVEMKVAELRRKVGSLASSGGGAIIYAGDLKWAVDVAINESFFSLGDVSAGYNPVEHLVTEIGRLLSDYSISNSKVWLIGTANYQTYMKCQTKLPPLEVQWALQPVSVPSGGLALSLHASSGFNSSRMSFLQSSPQTQEGKDSVTKEEPEKLTCCAECASNYEKDAGFFKSGQQKSLPLMLGSYNNKDTTKESAQLPYWMQPHRADSHQKDELADLRRKWNRLCHSLHHPRPNHVQTSSPMFKSQNVGCKSYSPAPSYSWWQNGSQYNQSNGGFSDSNSITFADSTSKPNFSSNLLVKFGNQQQSNSIEFGFGNGTQKHLSGLSLDSLKNTESKDLKITLALGSSLFPGSPKPRDGKRHEELCKVLQENVPWQSDAISSITEVVLDSKSTKTEGKWIMIKGNDWIGKRRLARAIAESLCESSDHLVLLNMRKENETSSCSRFLMEAIQKCKRSVVLIEEIDYADTQFIEFLSDISTDKCNTKNQIGGEFSFGQVIFILTTGNEGITKASEAALQMKFHVKESVSDRKRKAEWDLQNNNVKNPRIGDKGDVVVPPNSTENGHNNKKVYSRQSSSNTLDLNIRAEEDNEDGEEQVEDNVDGFSRDPSDLTQETMLDHKTPHGFLESIHNRFVFDQNPSMFDQMKESFSSKLKMSFQESSESESKGCLLVDKVVLEEIVGGSGTFLASLFEKWLKDVFQTCLQTVKKGRKEVTVRLSLGGKEESVLEEEGFMGSILPKTIQVAFME
ncbi:hypothetical protein Sjap_022975 [Stephania japonica]|uniref:Clp R domain-containing protein n=1 Tax=Stephania japonica TaxID=461633 RepID=A0AAP0EX06_9MAGN